MNNALERLQQLLKKLFQIEDAADLDFGIYTIMKYKRAEVVAFIDERLSEIVNEALERGGAADSRVLLRRWANSCRYGRSSQSFLSPSESNP